MFCHEAKSTGFSVSDGAVHKLKELLLQRSELLIDNKSAVLQLLKQIQLNKILQPKESNQINESDFGVISGLSDKSNGFGIGFNAKIR